MNPNLSFAQVRRGHNGDKGQARGLIEAKDFYFFLDAVQLLENDRITEEIKPWFSEFQRWLTDSKQGVEEFRASKNHGS